MTRNEFRQLLETRTVFIDGATGTELQKRGMAAGVCPEKWILDNPWAIQEVQKAYYDAGSDIVLAPTFTGTRIKLDEYGMAEDLVNINRNLVRLTREICPEGKFVAADISMTGKQLYPLGDLMFEDLVDCYKEQVRAILEEGVDLFVVETMMSLQECRAAVLAIKETCDLPIIVSLTYNPDGKTLYGTSPDTATIVLQSMGVDCIGMNCSTGPDAMLELVQQIAPVATVPIMCKPNAGLPELENGKTVYKMGPVEFTDACEKLYEAGASLFGGCCGSTPEHIRELVSRLKDKAPHKVVDKSLRVVTSERMNTWIDLDGPFMVIGERINPTGKKKFQESLRNGSLSMVVDFAREQEERGANILDVNMGMNGIDEKQMMLDSIYEVTSSVDLPLCIDTSHVDVMEAALRIYPGRALINSISAEQEKMEPMLKLAKKYGAMFITLPLSGAGLPKDMDEKKQHINTVLNKAVELGLKKEDAVVDVLVQTVGAEGTAGLQCFETIDYCKYELGLPTVCGLSNISFGMPNRQFVNTTYLTIAVSRGLTMAIANPNQEMLMYCAAAADTLMNKPGALEKYSALPVVEAKAAAAAPAGGTSASAGGGLTVASACEGLSVIAQCVVKGKKEQIVEEVNQAIADGVDPQVIIEEHLIKGINVVGELYDKKKYFLPQLIAGANAMETGMKLIEPLLASASGEPKATVVIATVEGDIHDIGKNLCALMLKNYGYNVIDMGKDIPAIDIVDKAMELNAEIIGLSALMTTTMMKMADVVIEAKNKGCQSKIIIGGACITESFKDEIGADGYSEDAAGCVKLVRELVG
ncbi:5-methyltetrahydrofolate--homocysteine methyltransferase [Pseudobutyrivibrio sp. UC1225]|uniref:homocysteine S-methyltransferase family protein n=1 Tax=Pseudobutyrivibrio sp. UC1225 TaxID=1798185 RepID=UPI0008E84048|nr:homocysteine S-methyltransferase family protein [Pseudobutyrivibrio sp. UC1225]SFO01663.1 5-methyltetrahydrofolate--homocysteine methyltransferase [Pseudobutyrivibrio sp. UC1225]